MKDVKGRNKFGGGISDLGAEERRLNTFTADFCASALGVINFMSFILYESDADAALAKEASDMLTQKLKKIEKNIYDPEKLNRYCKVKKICKKYQVGALKWNGI